MCLLLFLINHNKKQPFRLILANNRDEFYQRPAKQAWKWDQSSIIGGQDLMEGREGGTWLAVDSTSGHIGCLLNILMPANGMNPQAKGRGFLINDYLNGSCTSYDYVTPLLKQKSYNPFRLVLLHPDLNGDFEATSVSNAESGELIHGMKEGVFAFGNSAPGLSWKKVEHARNLFQETVTCIQEDKLSHEDIIEALFQTLSDNQSNYPDSGMKKQAPERSDAFFEEYSRVFLRLPSHQYGTRTQTVILVDQDNMGHFCERTLSNFETIQWTYSKFNFQLHG